MVKGIVGEIGEGLKSIGKEVGKQATREVVGRTFQEILTAPFGGMTKEELEKYINKRSAEDSQQKGEQIGRVLEELHGKGKAKFAVEAMRSPTPSRKELRPAQRHEQEKAQIQKQQIEATKKKKAAELVEPETRQRRGDFYGRSRKVETKRRFGSI